MISARFLLLSLALFAIAFSTVDAQQVLRGRVASSGGKRRGLKSSKAPTLDTPKSTKAPTVATPKSGGSPKSTKAPSVAQKSVTVSVEISESPKTSKAAKSEEVKISIEDDLGTLAEEKAVELSEEIYVNLEQYPKESPLRSLSPTMAGTV
eukprot:CAMPEP_0116148834 /NCGR_PEP_ID=MMETSP0329-20121206/18592_1 /TAXON_ID=697910 /ORGANISM="Pseudo-nitzschia arenysensis, Strain B593" /LENGTH=150 /DNA_ID=CAMNT_0003645041 /DNA_START=50 /DNA_END=502 /DNA_ORIENTATION=-